MGAARSDSEAVIAIPKWYWGGSVAKFADEAKLHVRPVDRASGTWRVEPLETYEKRVPRLFELWGVAPAGSAPNWAVLEALPATGITHSITPQMLFEEKERLLGAESPGSFANVAAWAHTATGAAIEPHFVAAVQGSFETLRQIVDSSGSEVFPALALHFIRVDEALSRRAALARVLVHVEEDPSLFSKPPRATGNQTVFGSAWHFQSDLFLTQGAYLGPLFLCLSPWVWAIPGNRPHGVVVYDLGTAVIGREGQVAEALQILLPVGGPTHGTPRPAVDPAQTLAAVSWWVEKIDKLMSEVSNPTNYVDSAGRYQPRRQFEVFLSIEQVGKRIQSVMANYRDFGARRLGAFAALDTLDGLGIIRFDQACTLSRAEQALQKLKDGLPPRAAAVLLPNAELAVEGLRDCQNGFFLKSKVSPGGVDIVGKQGAKATLTMEGAVAAYLRVVRNANHGFTGEGDANRRRDQVLLMAHEGDIPDGVALLPYLYWVETLLDPEQLLRRLAPKPAS